MKTKFLFAAALSGLLLGHHALAQDAPKSASKDKPTAAPVAPEKSAPTQAELEAKFIATLTKATLAGRWTAIKDGQLSPEKDDKYVIMGVTKVSGDAWLIHARIQYGKQNFVAPIPVQVKWAGDTPVIIVDKFSIPGGGTYSARLLVFDKTYAGTWSGGDHGGLLSGLITNE